jgi:hypothetical protein
MKFTIHLASALVAMLVLTTQDAAASTLLAMNLEELTQASDEICTGRVVDSTSFLEEGRIYTLHRVEIVEGVKGNAARSTLIEVVTAGGHSELFSQKVFGAAELEPNQTYLFFLEKRGTPGVVYPVGMTQGALPVSIDAATRMARVHPPKTLPRLVTRNPVDGRIYPGSPFLTSDRPLDDVIKEIRTITGGNR